jgi:hypothetical protein
MTTITLTFDNISGTQTSYTEKGFTVTAAEGASPPYYWDSTVLGINGYSGGALVDFENQIDTFTSSVGPFSVSSIQLEGRTGSGGPYMFTGIKSDGTIVTQTFQLDGVGGFQTFNFDSDFSNLVALKTDDASFAWIDNVVVSYNLLTITGTLANQAVKGNPTIDPFASVKITDLNSGQTETVTVTPSQTANGTLTDPNAATDGSTIVNGV